MSEVELFRIFWAICMIVNYIIMYKKKTLTVDLGTFFAIIWGPIFVLSFVYMWLLKKFDVLQPLDNVPKHKNEFRMGMGANLALFASMFTVISMMLLYLPMPK